MLRIQAQFPHLKATCSINDGDKVREQVIEKEVYNNLNNVQFLCFEVLSE